MREGARKERVFSVRDDFGSGTRKTKDLELFDMIKRQNTLRTKRNGFFFPISNWTELDVWEYIPEGGN